MFAFRHRLRRGTDIQSTIRGGKRVATPLVVGYVAPSSPDTPARVAVVVGRKVSLSAVFRHRLARQLRHGVAEYIQQHPNGYDIVFVVQPAARKSRKGELVGMCREIVSQVQSIISST